MTDDGSGDVMRVVSRPIVSGSVDQLPAVALTISLGEEIVVGKEGDLPVGISPADGGISRHALTIIAQARGWRIAYWNRNRAVEHRWAQRPIWRPAGDAATVRWPRLAVRLVGSRSEVQHWILMEADSYAIDDQSAADTQIHTDMVVPPLPLTAAQLEALTLLFPEHLAWPPIANPTTRSLSSVAKRLGISEAGVVDRLSKARDRAYALGSHQQFNVTSPDYLFVLIAHGYIRSPDGHVPALDLD
jgi:hypothetical protein